MLAGLASSSFALSACVSGAGSQAASAPALNADGTARRTLIKNGFVYTVDGANTVLPDGWILMQGDTIAAIGSGGDALPDYDQTIDASNKIVLPGFVNAHWHESYIAPNGESPDDSNLPPSPYANGGNIEALGSLFGFISGICKMLTPEESLAIARWSMWTQLRGGTTALGDLGSGNHWDGMGQAALDLGMRLRVSRWGSDIYIPNQGEVQRVASWEDQATDWEDLMSKWHDHPSGLVSGMPTVLAAFGSSDDQLAAMKVIADKYNSPFGAHIAPVKNETPALKRVFGKSAIERLDSLGLVNDRLISVHTSYASQAEFDLFVSRDVKVTHSPAHYGQLGEHTTVNGQLSEFLKAGVKLSTSTDGGIVYEGGMPGAMRAAHLMHNEVTNSTHTCPPTLALKTGTQHGAAALGWGDRIGSLEPGKQADIVLVDMSDAWRYVPGNHPLRTFLIAGAGVDVDTVIVAGETVVEEGRSTRLDEAAMMADYQKAVGSARARMRPPG
ncbi:MAG: amidohydrolase family protein [Hyphomonadaceae bacterium]|nr:amidohydrolase family protein [Hyphomonadaceae bacterium]